MKFAVCFFITVFAISLLIGFNGCTKKPYTPESITISVVLARRASIQGTVPHGGLKNVSSLGVCYATHSGPNLTDSAVYENGPVSGDVDVTITKLQLNTKYYVKIFSKLTNGKIYYGEEKSFTTNGLFKVGDIGPAGGLIYEVINPPDSLKDSLKPYHEAISLDGDGNAWGCYGSLITGVHNKYLWGYWDTKKIVESCQEANGAARVCWNLDLNGYSDWYLPTSFDLYQIRTVFMQTHTGNFKAERYWSCSQAIYEDPSSSAVIIDFDGGGQFSATKYSCCFKVIAARQF